MFGLGLLFYVTILLLNAVAILNEERFLARLVGDGSPSFGEPNPDTIKTRLLTLIRAIRTVMRPILVVFNIVIIFYELVLG